MTWRDLGSWVLCTAGTPLAWCSVGLHLRTPWRSTQTGRHLLVYSVVMAVVFSFGLWRLLADRHLPDWAEAARAAFYLALVVAMAWRVWLQARARKTSPHTDVDLAEVFDAWPSLGDADRTEIADLATELARRRQ